MKMKCTEEVIFIKIEVGEVFLISKNSAIYMK